MATNIGKSASQGAAKKTQTYNPATGQYVRRDARTGRFEATKQDGTPFEGIKKEMLKVRVNPNIPPETLARAHRAVAAVLARKAA